MISRISDLLFPGMCELCHQGLAGGASLCAPCADQLPRIRDPYCRICGEVFDGNLPEDFSCPNCQGKPFDFEFARAPLQGGETAFELVHALKYHRRFFIAKDLAKFLREAWEEDERFRDFDENCLVVPVPLHWRRQQWRHGNQAYELAREFAKLTSLPLCDALKRTRATGTQTKLNRAQRLSNLRNAFRVRRTAKTRLPDRDVILVDDVFTTGATSQACTKILKVAGEVKRVAILSLVRG